MAKNHLKLAKLKSEVSRKSMMANKRLARLEGNNLEKLSAYRNWVKGGEVRFGVAGKDYNQLQAELSRVNKFINDKTSLVREANKHLKNIASRVGISGNTKSLQRELGKFFEVTSKVEQYLRNVEGSASAIGYNKIWEVVSNYVKDERTDLNDAMNNIQGISETLSRMSVGQAMVDLEKRPDMWNLSGRVWDDLK